MRTYFIYTLAGETIIRFVYAKNSTKAIWKIIDRHGVDVKLKLLKRCEEKEILCT